MKKIFLAIAICLSVLFSGCEKDDICPETTQTTSLLVIGFYDINNPSVPKNVTTLEIKAANLADSLATIDGQNIAEIPLSVTENSVTYIFELNSANANANQDLLKFNYTRDDVFVSRACGYKTVFTLDPENPIELINTDASVWIQEIEIVEPNIETENETHVKIYF